ncbi:MAG: hypothetical protein HZC28_04945 [Spirochaetes bacterium]|nr:hypothetical protein [Spirochaetota bacterium]
MEAITLSLSVISPVVVYFVFRQFDKGGRTLDKINKWFKARADEFDHLFQQKVEQFHDNSIELDIAVKKADHLSRVLEGELGRISNRYESYKDYEAGIEKYSTQIQDIERAYLNVLEKIDIVLSERGKIDKTYRRINDIKRNVLDLEKNMGSLQKHLITSYNNKFAEFEKELYKRFELLADNLMKKDAAYNDMVEQEKRRIENTVSSFVTTVAEREKTFSEEMHALNERIAGENFERIRGIFDRAKLELSEKYNELTAGIQEKSVSIEQRYALLDESQARIQRDIEALAVGLSTRLTEITSDTERRFNEDIAQVKDRIIATINDSLNDAKVERDGMLSAFKEQAHTLASALDEKAAYIADDIASEREKALTLISETYDTFENSIKRSLAAIDDSSVEARDAISQEKEAVVVSMRTLLEQVETRVEAVMNEYAKREESIHEQRVVFENEVRAKSEAVLEMVGETVRGHLGCFDARVDERVNGIEERFGRTHEQYKKEYDDKVAVIVNASRMVAEEHSHITEMVNNKYNEHALRMREASEGLAQDLSEINALIDGEESAVSAPAAGIHFTDYIKQAKTKTAGYLKSIARRLEDKVGKRLALMDEERAIMNERVNAVFSEIKQLVNENLKTVDTMKETFAARIDASISEGEARITSRLNGIDSTLAAARASLESEYEAAVSRRKDFEERVATMDTIIDEHRDVFDSEHFKGLEAGVRGLQEEIVKAQTSFSASFAEKEHEFEERIQMLEGELKMIATDAKSSAEAQSREALSRIDAITGDIGVRIEKEMHTLRPHIEKTLESVLKERSDIRSGLEGADKYIRKTERAISERLNVIINNASVMVQKEIDTLDERMAGRGEELVKEFSVLVEREYAKRRTEIEAERDRQIAEMERVVRAAAERQGSDIAAVERAVMLAKETVASLAASASDALTKVAEDKDSLLADIRSTIDPAVKALDERFSVRIAEMDERFAESARAAQERYKEELTAVRNDIAAAQDEVAALSENVRTDIAATKDDVAALAGDVRSDIAAARGDIDTMLADMRSVIDPAARELDERFSARVAEMDERFAENARAAEERYREELSAVRHEIASTKDEVSVLSGNVRADIDAAQNEIAALLAKANEEVDNIRTSKTTLFAAVRSDSNAQLASVSQEIEHLKGEIAPVVARLEERFNESITGMNVRIAEAAKQLQARYGGDLSRIDKDISAMKKKVTQVASEAKDEIERTLSIKDSFTVAVKDNEKHLAELERTIKALKDNLEPTVVRLHKSFDESIEQLNERLTETSSRMLSRETEFKERFDGTLISLAAAYDAKTAELAHVIGDIKAQGEREVSAFVEKIAEQHASVTERSDTMLASIEERLNAIALAKEERYTALERRYRELSGMVSGMKDMLAAEIEQHTAAGTRTINERMEAMTSAIDGKEAAIIAAVNERLNTTVAHLMEQTGAEMETVRLRLAAEYENESKHIGGSINGLRASISEVEKVIAATAEEARAQGAEYMKTIDQKMKDRLELFDGDVEARTHRMLAEFDERAGKFIKDISRLSKDMETFKQAKDEDLAGHYAMLKERFAKIDEQVNAFMEEAKLLDRAEGLRTHLKKDLDGFAKLIKTTAKEKDELVKTMSEFNELKRMHDEVKGYSVQLQKEKTSLVETEEKVKLLVRMAGDIESQIGRIEDGNKNVPRIEAEIQRVLALAEDIQVKYDTIQQKKQDIDAAVATVYETEERAREIAGQVDAIKITLTDIHDKKERLTAKIREIEKDTGVLTKNEDKVKLLISRFEQVEQMLEFMNEQSEKFQRIRDYYGKQDEHIEDTLKRADKMAKTLEGLLREAESLILEAYQGAEKVTAESSERAVAVRPSRTIDAKKEKLVIDLYRNGWEYADIVRNTNLSIAEVEMIITQWKEKGKQA